MKMNDREERKKGFRKEDYIAKRIMCDPTHVMRFVNARMLNRVTVESAILNESGPSDYYVT